MRKVKIDVGRKVLSAAIVACLVLLLSTAAVAAEPVDLFLLVDGTDSISGANFTLQKEGYAYAINDSSVVSQDGSVSICVIMFGYWKPGLGGIENDYPSKVEVNLTTITSKTVADSVSAQIMAMAQPGDQTAIDSAFILANDTLNSFGDRPGRQIVDIATDGRPNINESWHYDVPDATAAAYAARNASVEKGYFDEVNSLGINMIPGEDVDFMKNLAYPQPWTSAPGFYIEAVDYVDFKDEIKEKLRREITGISITKSVNKTVCSPGDGLKYTIEYNNTGNVTLTGVILNDMIPANTTLVIGSISGGGSELGGVITWNIGNLNVGASGSQSFEVRVNDSVANGTQIINTATINSNEVGPKSDDATTTVISGPILGISKDVDKNVAKPNDVLTYTIGYDNTGNADATNTVINDAIPDNTTYAGSLTGLNCNYYAANRTIICGIGTLAPGSGVVSFKVTVNASVANGTVITNVATINSTEYGPVSDDASTTVEFKEYDLYPYKVVDKSVAAPNETLSYRIYYKNTGAGTLTSVTIKDTIPDDTTYVDGSLTGPGTYYASNKTIIWYIGTLNPGVDGNVTFEVKINGLVPGGTVIRNCVVLTSDQANPPDPCADTIVTRPPVAVPVLTPIGIIALIGLLSLVVIGSISIRRRRR
jgi:uncharacterized repeat protein (TIGR01451 family)